MGKILNKMVESHQTDWDVKLHFALCAYRTAEKITTLHLRFYLTYGLDNIIPIEFSFPIERLFVPNRLPSGDNLVCRFIDISKLEET